MERQIKFKFNEKEYSIEYPTVGQYLDIERKKIEISGGQWGNLIGANTKSSSRAVQIIDCLANIVVLCPDLLKDLKPEAKNLMDIDAKDFTILVVAYNKQVRNWYSEWFKEFNDIFQEEEDK